MPVIQYHNVSLLTVYYENHDIYSSKIDSLILLKSPYLN